MNKNVVLYITLGITIARILFIHLPISLPLYYGWFTLIAILSFKQRPIFCITTIILLIACVMSLVVNDVDPMFKPWERLISFTIMIAAIGPLNENNCSSLFKYNLFQKINSILVYGAAISFVGYLIHIPFFHSLSGFNGITNHSMTLSSISGLATVVCFHRYMNATIKTKKKIHLLLTLISVLSCLLGGSRGALIATSIGIIFYLCLFLKYNIILLSKYIIIIALIAALTSPLWQPYTQSIRQKNQYGQELGSLTASRDKLWQNRITEFKQSPIFGVGFASINRELTPQNTIIRTIEPGSSWLFLLSSIGLFGTIAFAILFYSPILHLLTHINNYTPEIILINSLLLFRGVHMFAEGYILASGDFGFLYIWLCIAVANHLKKIKQANYDQYTFRHYSI